MAKSKKRKRHVQLTLDSARKLTGQGGWRPGSGRPKGRKTVPHDKRPDVAARYPHHVTWRLVEGLPSLRRDYVANIMREAFAAASKASFRVVEYSIQGNHVHLIVEAAHKAALSTGLQGLAVRLARRINSALKRRGDLFATRFHSRVLRTPREVRNVLRYVLCNTRHHFAERGEKISKTWFDPYSSAAWFEGWKTAPRGDNDWKRQLLRSPRPTPTAQTWLLSTGWRRWGLLALDGIPGSVR